MARSFFLVLLALLLSSIGGEALAYGELRSQYADWQIRCKPAKEKTGTEKCILIQRVVDADRPDVSLDVIFLKTIDGRHLMMRVVSPLGVLLTSRLGIQIDQKDLGKVEFTRCLPLGCVAEVVVDEDLYERLSDGGVAMFVIFQTPEEGVGIPITLAKVEAGLKNLP